jgi:hypothetical protein
MNQRRSWQWEEEKGREKGGTCARGAAEVLSRRQRGALWSEFFPKIRPEQKNGYRKGVVVPRAAGSEPWIAPSESGVENGAGGQNRTDVASLEGWSFTTKLHPPGALPWSLNEPVRGWSSTPSRAIINLFFKKLQGPGFPAAGWPQLRTVQPFFAIGCFKDRLWIGAAASRNPGRPPKTAGRARPSPVGKG